MNQAEISFIVILAIMVAFYLIFIRPARQEQKRLEGTIRELQVGDEVITTAGFFATVRQITTPEHGPVEIVLDFGSGLQIRALTTSILRRVGPEAQPAERHEQAKGA